MKRFFSVFMVVMLSFFSISIASYSQSMHEYARSGTRFFDGTHVGITTGFLSPLDFNNGTPFNYYAGLKIGKNINSVFGFNIESIALFGDNHYAQSKTIIKSINTGINGVLDWTNIFGRYNNHRLVYVNTETGLGWLHQFPSKSNDLTAKTGLNIGFNLNKSHNCAIDFGPVIYWNLTGNNDEVRFNKHYAQFGVSVGFKYNFTGSNKSVHFKRYDITSMNDRINDLQNEVTSLKSREPEVKTVFVHDTITLAGPTYIMFAQNSDKLTSESKESLDKVSGTVNIYAYASPEGTKEYNKNLSLRRAKVVAAYLSNRGVTVKSVKGLGVVNNESNRIAIVKSN